MLLDWDARFEQFAEQSLGEAPDPAHDLAHIRRVVANVRLLAELEDANPAVVLPAAWLHDCVILPKDSPQRAQASRLAAARAGDFLRRIAYTPSLIPAIEHAIVAHSFSAGIPPQTLEAQVVQDADRLDALGAIGIARTLMLGGAMGKPLYDEDEPLPQSRVADDRVYVIDHFYTKLLRLAEMFHTAAGRREAERRTRLMRSYLAELERELSGALLPAFE
ncbi:conserved protein of unknown function [Candidatus Promineifilum breve]|uniref:HD/PDEase domain-containing protein n=1 Tax=Candidatus Promineifilum breve TaxID=1806508 RepID=A0A160T2W7_9CHLR|nr:HD domain-containing protein [Candidatus Promineifilum breve]CUS03992.2 conserved protein of unknown function [Candidatus Promineifilum breve]